MILVDTSIWVDHMRRSEPQLSALIEADRCLLHPFVLAELALGNLGDRQKRIARLQRLPSVVPMPTEALLEMIENLRLQGSGLGFVDAHLLGSCRDTAGTLLWSRDKRLSARAESLGVGWLPASRN